MKSKIRKRKKLPLTTNQVQRDPALLRRGKKGAGEAELGGSSLFSGWEVSYSPPSPPQNLELTELWEKL